MNGDKIMDAIGMIDDELIFEAREIRKRRLGTKKVLALVAALIILLIFGITSFAREYSPNLDEIEECVPEENNLYDEIETKELAEIISVYLKNLPKTERQIFVCRYYYLDSLAEISSRFGFSQSKIASMLHRTRKKILSHLEKEGVLCER